MPIAALAANHHQRVDGSGYPRGLGGDQLDVPMRVLAIADVYEALTADRPYRAAMPAERALAIIRAETPGKLDGGALAALATHLARVSDPLAAGVLTLSKAPDGAVPARVSGVRARGR
jgi:HD-GYP domain-containing protein (c-di-GMP phosphodiesterase class II)